MNNYFDIVGGKVVISNGALAIPAINEIWESTSDKDYAVSLIRYIVLKNHPKSPYVISLPSEEIDSRVRAKLFDSDWEPDEFIIEKEKEYIELSDTLSSKMLRSIRFSISEATKFLNGVNSRNMDLGMVTKILDNTQKAEKAIKAIDSLEKQVAKDELNSGIARGGVEIGYFEIPNKR